VDQHPEVVWAQKNNIPTLSQAEALAQLFNNKHGIAVCGVGGKSTVSAMIVWILHQLQQNASFSVGVGNIIGLNKTGHWATESEYFCKLMNTSLILSKPPVPRFSFLQPNVIVCTNLQFDHPDVYENFEMTKQTFLKFFLQLKAGGILIINGDDENLIELSQSIKRHRDDIKIFTFGTTNECTILLEHPHFTTGMSHASLTYTDRIFQLKLPLPGEFNIKNATAALLAVKKIGFHLHEAVPAIATFQSTQRRFELKGQKRNVWYFDDYAHHPHEIEAVIQALKQWFPNQRQVIAFQHILENITLRDDFASC
jgi:UDP-N-acetylmuramate--alanine ligase